MIRGLILLAHPQEMCHRKRSRSRRHGERPFWGSYPRKDRRAASKNVPTHGKKIVPRIHMRYDRLPRRALTNNDS